MFALCALLAGAQDEPAGIEARRQEALQRVETVSERFSRFDHKRLAVDSLSSLAALTCRYDVTAAAKIFEVGARMVAGEAARPAVGTDSARTPFRLVAVESTLLSRARQCDAELGRRLGEILLDGPTESLRAAKRLAFEDPNQSAELIAPLLARLPELTHAERADLMLFLTRFRRQSPEISDATFARAMTQVASSDGAGPGVWAALGAYVFPYGAGGTASQVRVTRAGQTAIFALGSESAAGDLAISWLHNSAGALMRGEEDLPARRAFARQLIPKAAVFAPELVEPLQHYLAATAETAAPRQEAAVGQPANPGDVLALLRFAAHWRGQRYIEARAAAEEIEDDELRAQVRELIVFSEAGGALGGGEVETALGIAGQLLPGMKRSLIYYGIASAHLAAEGKESGLPFLFMSAGDARSADASARAQLLLLVAKAMARIEFEPALVVATDAIRAMNEQERHVADSDGSHFFETLETGSFQLSIKLRIPYEEPAELTDVVSVLAEHDVDRVDALVQQLRDEERTANALLVLAELRLQRAFRESTASDRR